MKKLTEIVSSLILSSSLLSCSSLTIYDNLQLRKPDPKNVFIPCKRSIENYMYRIFESGFLRKKQSIKKEIFDNYYGIFEKDAYGKNTLGSYFNRTDTVALNEILFVNKITRGNVTYFVAPKANAAAILIHELFHDFWYNDLVSPKEKEEFSKESRKIYERALLATTKERKLDFLESIGLKNAKEEHFKPFLELMACEENYDSEIFFSTELYSRFAEGSYGKKMIIPKQLREYYEPLISKEWLNRDTLK